MGSEDRDDDNLREEVRFAVDGEAKLKQIVNEKLTEIMGYTDDSLVEYVMVLIRNRRGKEAMTRKLDVFLGDDLDSFVSWLWDHLASHSDLYLQPEALHDEAPKIKDISEVQDGGDVSQHLNSESERSSKLSRRRHKDWKGLARGGAEPPPLRSSDVDNTHLDEKTQPKVNRSSRSSPPTSPVRRKRNRADEQQKTKRDAVSQATVSAPRRLLQFAVRDAVATSRSPNSITPVEPSLKRLRSVVSTSSGDSSLVDRPQRIQSVSRVVNPMATVIKAVAEAAEDVIKVKSSRSVFDRLGRGMDPSAGSGQLEDNYQSQEQNQYEYSGQQYDADMTMLKCETDSISDNEGCDDVDIMGQGVTGTSQIDSSGGNRVDNLPMVQNKVAKNADDSMNLKWNRDQEQLAAAPNPSHKVVNFSANVNTWKPAQYQESRVVAEVGGHDTAVSGTGAPKSGLLLKENANPMKIINGNANPAVDIQKEAQKTQLSISGSSAAGRPLEDADSRTIFVSNVHFAATKDSLSRHFNKSGEVLKVVIVTDAMTGQPKGAAYVEFMRKEAADNALSLDGTSFMSRILKVVKKSAAQQESASVVAWPHMTRGSPFPPARFSRVPFARGMPGAFRPRPPLRIGARSLQWKRDAQGTTSDNGASSNAGSMAAPAPRSLTYVRPESKPEGNLGTT
ncbi:hypothetical protein L6164_017994 [Bauhinia variegata]|uniref:Uncharacterized protein n=1 Tax=Bauhinia variegata TaxID=167791 RepID=A0ACB9NAV1_BAUVA|nr:hypothetical protein L6164_017994 [Bauhinia variegata]